MTTTHTKFEVNSKVVSDGVNGKVIFDDGADTLLVEANGERELWDKVDGAGNAVGYKPKPEVPLYLRAAFDMINAKKGQIGTMDYRKTVDKVKKKYEAFFEGKKIVKRSVFQVRAGINYENIAVVKEGHETGQVERKGLPDSMVKVETGIYYNENTDVFYVGCGGVTNTNSVRYSEFTVDGKTVELDAVIGFHDTLDKNITLRDALYAKDIKSSSEALWLTLPIKNIKAFK
jgi:hypothetical protein